MTLDISRIRGLCFDVDGTLSDTDDLWVSKVERVLHPAYFLFRNRQVRPAARWLVMGMESPGNYVYSLLDRLGLDDELSWVITRRAKKRSHPQKKFWIVEGVKEMLEMLGGRYPLTVVSARDEHSTHAFLEQFELPALFKAVATAQTTEFTKPFPHPLLWAAEQMGVPAEACVMVGDTTMDIKAGRAAGMQTVGVLCGFGTEKELRRAGADLILDSTADLMRVLS